LGPREIMTSRGAARGEGAPASGATERVLGPREK
jgi:hypothetical protein